MKTLLELINEKTNALKLTTEQAKNYVCQEIIIKKISSSEYVDRILLKGGVVMFNMTKNQRRATRDMDFDLVRYDISSKETLDGLIHAFNKNYSEYVVSLVKCKELHQQDYHGCRLYIKISDKTAKLDFTIDVGVHTLFEIDQIDSIFQFGLGEDNKFMVKVNPPEQIIAEKLYSIAKIGILSTRYKDIFDVYYLITNSNPKINVVNKCFDLLSSKGIKDLNNRSSIIRRVEEVLNNDLFVNNLLSSNSKWLDIDYLFVKDTILAFIK